MPTPGIPQRARWRLPPFEGISLIVLPAYLLLLLVVMIIAVAASIIAGIRGEWNLVGVLVFAGCAVCTISGAVAFIYLTRATSRRHEANYRTRSAAPDAITRNR